MSLKTWGSLALQPGTVWLCILKSRGGSRSPKAVYSGDSETPSVKQFELLVCTPQASSCARNHSQNGRPPRFLSGAVPRPLLAFSVHFLLLELSVKSKFSLGFTDGLRLAQGAYKLLT